MKKSHSRKIGQCLCGGIKFRIKGKLRFVSNCHCIQCMKTHGNYASYTACEQNKLEFLNYNTLKWYKSSIKANRGFCKKCGASVFFKRIKSKFISISAGMFNNPTKLKTKMNIFTKEKLDYYVINSKIPKYHRYP